MMHRKKLLVKLRPQIQHQSSGNPLDEVENFQNHVIRPILKFQNNWLVKLFRYRSLEKYKVTLSSLPPDGLKNHITRILNSDHQLRFMMIGGMTGLMSGEELQYYLHHEKELRRRSIQMIKERLWDQLLQEE